jgi:hypothetical protein
MNAAHRTLAALFVAAALSACGAGSQEARPAPAEDNVLKDMTGTMDKARGVEDTTLEHKEELDRAMEAAQ